MMKTNQKIQNFQENVSIKPFFQNRFLTKVLIYFITLVNINVRADDYNPNQDSFNFLMTTFIPFIILYGLYLIKCRKIKENEKKKIFDKFLIYFEGFLSDISIIISCFVVPLISFYFSKLPINNYRIFIYGNCSSFLSCTFLIIYFWLIDIFANNKQLKHLRNEDYLLRYNLQITAPFAIMDIFYIIFAFSVNYLNIKIIVLIYFGVSMICKSIISVIFKNDRIKFFKYITSLSLLAYLIFTCYLSAVFLSTNFYQTQAIFLIVTIVIFRILFYLEGNDEDYKDENKNEDKENEDVNEENKDEEEDEEKGNTIKDEKRRETHGYFNYLMSFKSGDERRKYKRHSSFLGNVLIFGWIACIVLPFIILIPILLV